MSSTVYSVLENFGLTGQPPVNVTIFNWWTPNKGTVKKVLNPITGDAFAKSYYSLKIVTVYTTDSYTLYFGQ